MRRIPEQEEVRPRRSFENLWTALRKRRHLRGQQPTKARPGSPEGSSRPLFLKCGPRASNISRFWRLVRNAVSGPAPDLLNQNLPITSILVIHKHMRIGELFLATLWTEILRGEALWPVFPE